MPHTPPATEVAAQPVAGRPLADYTLIEVGDGRACHEHRTDNTAGYVVRHTITTAGQVIRRPDGGVGVDVFAVESTPTWGHYDAALVAAYELRHGRGWAVVDRLYRCGHRSGA